MSNSYINGVNSLGVLFEAIFTLGQVVDSFGSERDAYIYSVKHFQMGTFLIREVISKCPTED